MPADEKVTIIIVGKDQISKVLGGITKKTEKLADGFDDADKKAKKGLFKTMGELGQKSSQLGSKITQTTAPLMMYGQAAVGAAIESQRLSKTLTALAKDVGGAEAIITAIGDASLGTVGKLDAMKIANRALSFGVVKNTAEMKTLTEVAITLGRAQGLTATQAVSDFTTALSRNSPMILDNLGITLKMTEAYEIYAEKIGVAVSALSAGDKQIAFREAALIKGIEAMEKMGGLQEDMAGSQEKLNAQMENMSLIVGEALIPLKQIGLDAMQPLIKGFQDADPAIQKVVIGFGFLASSAGPALSSIGKVLTGLEKLQGVAANAGGAMNVLKTAMTGVSGALLGVGVAVGVAAAAYVVYKKLSADAEDATIRVGEAVKNTIEEFEKLEDTGYSASATMSYLAETLRTEVNVELQKDGNLLVDLQAAFLRATRSTSIYEKTTRKANRAIFDSSETTEDYIKSLKEYNKRQKEANLRILSVEQAQKLSNKSMYQEIAALKKITPLQAVQERRTVAFTKAQQKLLKSGFDVLEFGEKLAKQTEDFIVTEAEKLRALENSENQMVILYEQQAHLRDLNLESAEALDEMTRATAGSDMAMLNNIAVREAGIYVTDKDRIAREKMAHIIGLEEQAEEKAVAAQEKAVAAREKNTERIQELQEKRKQAALDVFAAETDLITSLQDATAAQFKQKIFSMIDFGDDLDKYVKVGIELDLITPESANLALSIQPILDEVARDNLPVEKMSEALDHVFTAFDKGSKIPLDKVAEETGKILRLYTDNPMLMEDAAKNQELHNDALDRLAHDIGVDAYGAATDIHSALEAMADKTPDYRQKQEEYNEKLGELPEDVVPKAIEGIDNLSLTFEGLPKSMRKSEEFLGQVNKTVLEMEGTHYVDFIFRYHNWDPSIRVGGGSSTPDPPPGGRQMGGLVPGRIGERVPVMAHGGEYIVNPNHRGAMGGPGGPPLPGTTNNEWGGDTINVTINDRMAAALFLNDLEGRRYDDLDHLM